MIDSVYYTDLVNVADLVYYTVGILYENSASAVYYTKFHRIRYIIPKRAQKKEADCSACGLHVP